MKKLLKRNIRFLTMFLLVVVFLQNICIYGFSDTNNDIVVEDNNEILYSENTDNSEDMKYWCRWISNYYATLELPDNHTVDNYLFVLYNEKGEKLAQKSRQIELLQTMYRVCVDFSEEVAKFGSGFYSFKVFDNNNNTEIASSKELYFGNRGVALGYKKENTDNGILGNRILFKFNQDNSGPHYWDYSGCSNSELVEVSVLSKSGSYYEGFEEQILPFTPGDGSHVQYLFTPLKAGKVTIVFTYFINGVEREVCEYTYNIDENLNITFEKNENNGILYGDANYDNILTAADASLISSKVLDSSYGIPIEKNYNNWINYIDVDSNGYLTTNDAAIVLSKVLNFDYMMPVEIYD